MNEYEPPAATDLDLKWGIPRWALIGGVVGGGMLAVLLAAAIFALAKKN